MLSDVTSVCVSCIIVHESCILVIQQYVVPVNLVLQLNNFAQTSVKNIGNNFGVTRGEGKY